MSDIDVPSLIVGAVATIIILFVLAIVMIATADIRERSRQRIILEWDKLPYEDKERQRRQWAEDAFLDTHMG